MKKLYDSFKRIAAVIGVAAIGVTGYAADVAAGGEPKATVGQSMLFYYGGNPVGSVGFRDECYAGGAMSLSELIRERYDGCSITAVQVANGQFVQESSAVTVFLSEGLDKAPIQTVAGEMDATKHLSYKEYILDEPVEISVSKPLFVGYTVYSDGSMVGNKGNMVISFDGTPTSETAGYLGQGATADPAEMRWQNVSEAYGSVSIKLRIEGDNLPVDLVEITSLTVTDYVAPGQNVRASIGFANRGLNTVKSVELVYEFDNGEVTYAKTFPLAIKSGGSDKSTVINAPCETVANNIPFKIRVTKVNDREPGKGAVMDGMTYVLCMPGDEGYGRNMVMEEVTSLTCGWCPRGIVGVASMLEAHNDGTFIPICISSGSDPDSYKMGINYGSIWSILSSMPSCLINRNLVRFGVGDPGFANLERYYTALKAVPGVAEIKLKDIEINGDLATVKSETVFALDEDAADYRVAYVVTENHVGPNMQWNYYTGGASGVMGGWEKLGGEVETYHNHFARAISNFHGDEGSIPAEIEAGKTYEYTGTVDLSQVTDINNIEVIALVINEKTGAIENGVTATPYDIAGVEVVAADGVADDDGEVEYFDLQGRPTAYPTESGIYIRRQGGESSKVVVK